MQTPAEIDFQGMDPSAAVRTAIENHISQLEERFGRITAGRAVVKAPGGRHRTGGLYEIAVHLSLPDGREVNVDRVRQNDERFADLNYALNDAFKRARRQLQDNVRELQGQVKLTSASPVGTVAELDPLGEFGFIKTDDDREIYFHRNSVLGDGYAQLSVGARVAFAEEMGDKGPQASTVKPLNKHSMKV